MRRLGTGSLVIAAIVAILGVTGWSGAARAQEWKLVRPSNTGIPGEEVRLVRFAPDGALIVGARWPFWGEGGLGVLDRDADLWSTVSNADGTFPSAFPNDLAFGPGGEMWVATGNGLVKIDGGQVTTWNAANSPLLHDTVMSVDVDSTGKVWLNNSNVQNNSAAIFSFDGVQWTSYQVGAQLPWNPPWNALSDVMVDHLDHVWVANQVLNGVAEFDGVSWTLHGASVGRFGEIREDAAGNIWLRAGTGGGNSFWKFDGNSFQSIPVSTTPTSIGIDPSGPVYLGLWNGTVLKTTNFGQTFQTFLTGLNQVFEIEPDPANSDVWIGTIGAVGHFLATGQFVRDYNSANTGMPDYFIDRFDLDRDGNLWLASGETGLSRYDGLKWRNFGAHNAGAEPYPFGGNEPMGSFYLDSNGNGWMGGNGIARWDPATNTITGFWNWQNNPGMGVTLFVAITEDRNGVIWAFTEYGLGYTFDPVTQLWVKDAKLHYAPSGLPGVARDSQGNLWVAGWFDVSVWDGSSWTVVSGTWDLFGLGGANDIAIGPDDVVWIGTQGGLLRYDGQLVLFHEQNSPLPTDPVVGVDVRGDGVIGLSASKFGSSTPFPNGVCIIDGDPAVAANWKVWQYGTSAIPHYQLGKVAFDAEGNLWVSAISEATAVLLDPARPLSRSDDRIAGFLGGEIDLALDAGVANAGRSYLVLASASGTSPGVPLPGGEVLPLNLDLLTDLALQFANTPVFQNFLGVLDGSGQAVATLDTVAPVAGVAGLKIDLAFALVPQFDFASNAVAVRFTP